MRAVEGMAAQPIVVRSADLPQLEFTRRQTVAALGATAALPLLARSVRASAAPANEAQAKVLLDSFAENLLRLEPTSAPSLGIDTGLRASYRFPLEDRSSAVEAIILATVRAVVSCTSVV